MTILEKFLHIYYHADTRWEPAGVPGRFEGTLEKTSVLVNFNSKTMIVGEHTVFHCDETEGVFSEERLAFIRRRCNARPYVETA